CCTTARQARKFDHPPERYSLGARATLPPFTARTTLERTKTYAESSCICAAHCFRWPFGDYQTPTVASRVYMVCWGGMYNGMVRLRIILRLGQCNVPIMLLPIG